MLAEHVRTFLVDETLGQEPHQVKGLSATSALTCLRLMWYLLNGMVDDTGEYLPKASRLERLSDGYIHQDKFGQQLRRMPNVEVLEEDTYVVYLDDIFCRVDFRIRLDGVLMHIEFKSFGNETYQLFLDNGVIAFPHYHAQTQVMAAGEPDVPVLFYAKNVENGNHADELVHIDQDEVDLLRGRSAEFESHRDSEAPPSRPYDISDPHCMGCPARMICWFSGLRDYTIYETVIADDERDKLRGILKKLQANLSAVNDYNFYYQALRNYLAVLHARHQRSRLAVRGVSSTMFDRRTTQIDRDYIKVLLTEEEQESVFFTHTSQSQRIIVKWDEVTF